MTKKYIVITSFLIIIISLCGYFTIMSLSFPFIQEVDARCPNGYHKSPSGDCEKVTDTKGMPRCPNGYHRSPETKTRPRYKTKLDLVNSFFK